MIAPAAMRTSASQGAPKRLRLANTAGSSLSSAMVAAVLDTPASSARIEPRLAPTTTRSISHAGNQGAVMLTIDSNTAG